ncbi:UNVERIFIED_CONTAM: hypothetical protein PYX00_004069 [Menopon gallinae]|uniref:1-acyl-sn-glycerol-3-phosphate acyltransferase n=1 Tax=Menopon gallinae TaxID=328185 RepID=A0AAW2I366_9NEOP
MKYQGVFIKEFPKKDECCNDWSLSEVKFRKNFPALKDTIRYLIARIALYSVLLLTGLVCIPIFLLSPGDLENSKFYAKYVGRHTSRLYGISWDIRQGRRLARRGGAVLVANHQHELDIIGMFVLWPIMDGCAAVAKRELLCNPFGLAALLGGVVFIDRKNPRRAKDKINRAARILRRGRKIFVFPEGTRNKTVREDKTILPFKKGAFRIAIESQVPIVPVVFSPYYFIDDNLKILRPGGKIVISVLPPVPTTGLYFKDIESLIYSVRRQMQCEYNRLDEEIKKELLMKELEKKKEFPGLSTFAMKTSFGERFLTKY